MSSQLRVRLASVEAVATPDRVEDSVTIEALPADGEEEATDEVQVPRHPAARRILPPPWAGARRPPWAAVLPEPEPMVRSAPELLPRVAPEPAAEAEYDAVMMEVPLASLHTEPDSAAEPEPAPAPVIPIAAYYKATPPGMVLVPRRTVRTADHSFIVDPYHLDRDVVTQADWASYLKARGGSTPAGWRGRQPPKGQELCPMTDITFDEARAYAAWRGARLPTVAEWLAAAAGLSWFPHGNEVCPAGLCQCPRAGMAKELAPVGSHPRSNSDDGARDLLGLVWEWAEADARLSGPDPEHAWALGGSYKHVCPGLDPKARTVPQTMIHRAKTWPYLGFRCARSLE